MARGRLLPTGGLMSSPLSEPDAGPDLLAQLSHLLTEFVLGPELDLLDAEERGTMTRAAALVGELRSRRSRTTEEP